MGIAAVRASPERRNSLVGLALMVAATALFVAMTALVKSLREDGLTTPQVMLWRTLPAVPWVFAELHVRRVAWRPKAPALVAWRCAFGLCAMVASFYAVRDLTLVQHNVLHLLQPVFVAVLAPFVLQERLRAAAIVALVLASSGALAVIDPSREIAELPFTAAAAGLAAALCSAFAHMSVRQATARDSPELVVFHFTLSVTAVSLGWALLSGDGLLLPTTLDPAQAAPKIAAMAGLGLAGQLLMTRAYERAPAPVVAVVAYASIPLSFALDVMAWGAPVSATAGLGSALMVVAGVLLVRGRTTHLKSPSAPRAMPRAARRGPAHPPPAANDVGRPE